MSVSTVTHLNFTGECRQALEFYHSIFGGHIMIATYDQVGVPRDSPDSDKAVFAPVDADSPDADHVAFGMVATDTFRLAAYDVFGVTDAPRRTGAASRRADGLTHSEPFFVLLNGETLEELTDLWAKLAQGATVIQALAPASWAPAYGMLTDRFGVTWVFGLTPTT